MRIGYAAAISQMDAALAVLLEGLKTYNFDDSTMVILVGDNGFNLGKTACIFYEKELIISHRRELTMVQTTFN